MAAEWTYLYWWVVDGLAITPPPPTDVRDNEAQPHMCHDFFWSPIQATEEELDEKILADAAAYHRKAGSNLIRYALSTRLVNFPLITSSTRLTYSTVRNVLSRKVEHEMILGPWTSPSLYLLSPRPPLSTVSSVTSDQCPSLSDSLWPAV